MGHVGSVPLSTLVYHHPPPPAPRELNVRPFLWGGNGAGDKDIKLKLYHFGDIGRRGKEHPPSPNLVLSYSELFGGRNTWSSQRGLSTQGSGRRAQAVLPKL